ncbi:hypothetical protein CDAR_572051 [Caerostris darwini]|uniref:Ribosomal protein L33 n=1 Tax=Caerostris darwini TaxID=1538125 RepID=A0AAV4SYT8_9ARAC|nr:hypothetical protein CDAR_572051 [Caerostris darwini]
MVHLEKELLELPGKKNYCGTSLLQGTQNHFSQKTMKNYSSRRTREIHLTEKPEPFLRRNYVRTTFTREPGRTTFTTGTR